MYVYLSTRNSYLTLANEINEFIELEFKQNRELKARPQIRLNLALQTFTLNCKLINIHIFKHFLQNERKYQFNQLIMYSIRWAFDGNIDNMCHNE